MKDLTGLRFGRLVVCGLAPRNHEYKKRWFCLCDCGTKRMVDSYRLTSGETKSCGCLNRDVCSGRLDDKYKGVIGRKFGKLTVIERTDRRKRGMALYRCVCECGGEILTILSSLGGGNTKSCGCLRAEQALKISVAGTKASSLIAYLGKNVSLSNFLYAKYRGMAERRGVQFLLARQSFDKMVLSDCFYCGSPPGQELKLRRLKGRGDILRYNGIDRIDSDLGYIDGNVVPCCWICNRAKGNSSFEDFREWAIRLGRSVSGSQFFDILRLGV